MTSASNGDGDETTAEWGRLGEDEMRNEAQEPSSPLAPNGRGWAFLTSPLHTYKLSIYLLPITYLSS